MMGLKWDKMDKGNIFEEMTWSRRRFVKVAGSAVPVMISALSGCRAKESGKKKIKVAVVMTAFFYRSHAHVILENFLQPYLFNGKVVDPRKEFEIMSFYVDQIAEQEGTEGDTSDMSREVAKEFGIPIYETINEALCLGNRDMAIDAVLMIGEHGKYPFNDKGQELYPKKQFFDEIVEVYQRSKRVVPLYCDKHLSHEWGEAKEMYDTAQKMKFGLMAGSFPSRWLSAGRRWKFRPEQKFWKRFRFMADRWSVMIFTALKFCSRWLRGGGGMKVA